MTILIVDDNDDFRRLVKSLVKDFSDEIAECTDGTEAIKFCNNEMPDLILMDIQMKNMDGLTATKKILSINRSIKIIILTQFNDAVLERKARQHGAIEFLTKDNLFQLNDLLENISNNTGE